MLCSIDQGPLLDLRAASDIFEISKLQDWSASMLAQQDVVVILRSRDGQSVWLKNSVLLQNWTFTAVTARTCHHVMKLRIFRTLEDSFNNILPYSQLLVFKKCLLCACW